MGSADTTFLSRRMNIFANNPYRLLGVYSNSPTKERVANKGRMNAFLKVGKQVSFPLDLPDLLSLIERDVNSVSDAESNLTLPVDQIRYAMFWWMKSTPLDDIAFNHLFERNIDMALSIWEKKNNVSSLQNRITLALTQGKIESAIECAESLYTQYADEFTKNIVGDSLTLDTPLWQMFFDMLLESGINAQTIANSITISEWKEYISQKTVAPLIDSITKAIATAKSSKDKGPSARLKAGQKLMAETKSLLSQLKQILPATDIRYQTIADKLAIEILQCGIDYYNDSEDDDCAIKAIKLQKYALSISVGSMAKDRCRENVGILEQIIAELPPIQAMPLHRAIQKALKEYSILPDKICHAIDLMKKCAPHIVEIKTILGQSHSYYLNMSTNVVNNALGNVIAEVNTVLNGKDRDIDRIQMTLKEAWRATLCMDKFDLDEEFKEGRYKENRETLYDIVDKLGGFRYSIFGDKITVPFCNDLDVSDVDLRTEEELYSACNTISSCNLYLTHFPNGKYVNEIKVKIETLRLANCRTISDYKKFISTCKDASLIQRANQKIQQLKEKAARERKLKEERERIEKEQSIAVESCRTLKELIELYNKEKDRKIDLSHCSQKAFKLSRTKDDYERVLSTFGLHSEGGRKAKSKLEEIEKKEQEKKETYRGWAIFGGVVLAIIFIAFLIGGLKGVAIGCWVITFLTGVFAFGAVQEKGGCSMALISVTIAIICGWMGVILSNYADELNKKKRANELYMNIKSNPTIEDCEEYIFSYRDSQNANEVNEILYNLLVSSASTFDDSMSYIYYSEEEKPLTKLVDFANNNKDTRLKEMALDKVKHLCDSFYTVANKKSTEKAWITYQQSVPTQFWKDSEDKIEEIKNRDWNTEAKAWNTAKTENTIGAYKRYQSLYPKGKHYAQAEKKIIDFEVAGIMAGDYGEMPSMEKTSYGGGSTSRIRVTNNTSYILTIRYSGPNSKRLDLPPNMSASVTLPNGTYRIAASVSASNVRNYAGIENLSGGSYESSYYISSTDSRY